MKRTFLSVAVIMLFVPQISFAYDWEEEEGGVEREIQLNRNRNYPGGADEQDLKVQKSLTQATRSPEVATEVFKREDAERDEE